MNLSVTLAIACRTSRDAVDYDDCILSKVRGRLLREAERHPYLGDVFSSGSSYAYSCRTCYLMWSIAV